MAIKTDVRSGTCMFCGRPRSETVPAGHRRSGHDRGTYDNKGNRERAGGHQPRACRDCLARPFKDAGRSDEWIEDWWKRQVQQAVEIENKPVEQRGLWD